MRRLLPQRLLTRLLAIWLIGMLAMLAVSFGLFLSERSRISRTLVMESLGQDVASAVRLLDNAPPAERLRWLGALSRRRVMFSLGRMQMPPPPLPADAPLAAALRAALPEHPELAVSPLPPGPGAGVLLQLNLSDGTPLTIRVHARFAPPPAPWPQLFIPLLGFLLGALAFTGFALYLALRPLSLFAEAARSLGEDPERPPLPEKGPLEVRRAVDAFNQMQLRIQSYLAERTRILAAISHDLQTPITRLRLRSELLKDEALRDKFEGDLDAMQSLVHEGLDYARSRENREPVETFSLDALLAAIAADALDMGWDVSLHGSAPTPMRGRHMALRRAIWNLVENGVKFGRSVKIQLTETPGSYVIRIADHGPGIPEEELEKVFEPFYRGEASRNRDTGGTGLGLAIARNLVRAQGGDITLSNAHPGLMAEIRLPR